MQSNSHRPAAFARPIFAELLESRVLLSTAPVYTTGSTTTSGSNATVSLVASDPLRGDMPWSYTYSGTSANYWQVSNTVVANNVATWTAYHMQSGEEVSTVVGCAVYDPIKGSWEIGGKTYSTGWTIESDTDSAGVVAWWAYETSGENQPAEVDCTA
jgi:hypothetical protein